MLSSHKENLLKDHHNIFLEERIFFELDSLDVEKISYSIERPVFYTNNQRLESFEKCEKIFNSIMNDLFIVLNKIHNVNWQKRSWEILIGHWLKKFIYIVFFKYHTIQSAFNNNKISNVFLSSSNNNEVASNETWAIYDLSVDKEWSWILSSKIIPYIDSNKANFEKPIIEKIFFYKEKTYYERTQKNIRIILKILNKFSHLISFFFRNYNLIAITYLSLKDEKKLEISFLQIPRFYSPPKIKYGTINHNLREKIKITNNDFCTESKIIRDLIPSYLPTFAVENFNNLKLAVDKNNYPSNPKFVFTSNLFETDEAFKFYLANNINSAQPAKYFVGQHGNSYLTRIDNDFANEYTTCDYFLSWGEKNLNNKKIISLFNFKNLNYKKYSKVGKKLLLVLRALGDQSLPYDRWYEGQKEYNLTKSFLLSIKDDFKYNTIIRLYQTFTYTNQKFVQKFLNNLEDFEIDFGIHKYEEVVKESKIVIFCYDSTGFLESLVTDKPSICFYPNIFNHLNNDCKEDYKILQDAKIIFDDGDKLKLHLESIWDDPQAWWNLKEVANARNAFSRLFSKTQNNQQLNSIKEKIIEKLN